MKEICVIIDIMSHDIFSAVAWRMIQLGGVLVCLGVIAVNIGNDPFQVSSLESRLQQMALLAPLRAETHLALAQYYGERNPTAAQEEQLAADELQESGPVLGLATVNAQNARMVIEEKILLWEHVHQVVPDYRYAVAQLALLSHQLGNKKESDHYLGLLFQLDPVDPLLPQLRTYLK